MTSPGLRPGARPVAATCCRTVRRRLAYVRGHERTLAALRGLRCEVAVRTCVRLRREARLQLQAPRQRCRKPQHVCKCSSSCVATRDA